VVLAPWGVQHGTPVWDGLDARVDGSQRVLYHCQEGIVEAVEAGLWLVGTPVAVALVPPRVEYSDCVQHGDVGEWLEIGAI